MRGRLTESISIIWIPKQLESKYLALVYEICEEIDNILRNEDYYIAIYWSYANKKWTWESGLDLAIWWDL